MLKINGQIVKTPESEYGPFVASSSRPVFHGPDCKPNPCATRQAMSDRFCDKFPSMERRFCAHCQGTLRGTAENPNFSTIEYSYRGYPVVEILKNGGQVHRHDKHFRFGCRIARILLTCLPELKTFAWPSSEKERTEFKPQIFTDSGLGITIEAFVTMSPNFVVSDEVIEKYWLRLVELPDLEVQEGLGVVKCQAVCSLQDELRGWLARRCH